MSDLEYDIRNRVAWIRLNRPQRKNAFSLEMMDAWARRLQEAFNAVREGRRPRFAGA